MATPRPKTKIGPKPKAEPGPESRLAGAALKRLAKTPWHELTLAAVAKSARLSLRDVQPVAASKSALVGLILRRIGQDVSARYKPESGAARDRLFDVAMCWFDVLASHKPAVRALYDGFRRDPLSLLASRDGILEAANWLLVLAEADTGPALPLRALGLAAALGRAIPVWLDDGSDMARTMAQLDIDLSRGETLLHRAQGTKNRNAD